MNEFEDESYATATRRGSTLERKEEKQCEAGDMETGEEKRIVGEEAGWDVYEGG